MTFTETIIALYKNTKNTRSFEQITIESKGGKSAIIGTSVEGYGFLKLYNKEGNISATVSGGTLFLYGPDGKERVYLGHRETDNSPGTLELRSKGGQQLVRLNGDNSGGSAVFYNPEGYLLANIGGFLVPAGQDYKSLTAGALSIYGFNGKPVMSVGITTQGDGAFSLYDRYKKTIIQFPENANE